MKDKRQIKKRAEQEVAVRVSLVSIIGNIILTVFKFFAGFAAHSTAMVSDAVHSASDVISSVIVIAGVKVAAKTEDEHHPYGHERIESLAAALFQGARIARMDSDTMTNPQKWQISEAFFLW